MSLFSVNSHCNGCLACVQNCPADALTYTDTTDKRILHHSVTRCARCGHCWRVCPQDAIEFHRLLDDVWAEVVSLPLVRCSVCNEIIYTAEFKATVQNRLERNLQPLCPQHREELNRMAAAHSSKVKP